MSQESYRRASSVAQAVVGLFDDSLVVDGKWGSFSMRAYNGLSDSQRTLVDNALNGVSKGTKVKDLFDFRIASKESASKISVDTAPVDSDGRWVTASQMRTIIQKVSGMTSISEDILQKFLDLEAAVRFRDGGREYDRLAVNSLGYSGLFQFDKNGNAWSGAALSVKGLGPFNPSWKDAYQNTLAAAGYILTNTRAARKGITSPKGGGFFQYKGPITANIAYLMHNQGALGMMQIISGRKVLAGSQSDKAVSVARAAMADGKQTA